MEKSKIALEQFDFNLSQARKRLEIARKTLLQEKSYLVAKKERLNLKALISGKIINCLPSGSFVKQGQIICTIKAS